MEEGGIFAHVCFYLIKRSLFQGVRVEVINVAVMAARKVSLLAVDMDDIQRQGRILLVFVACECSSDSGDGPG